MILDVDNWVIEEIPTKLSVAKTVLHKLYRSASHVIASTTYIAERIEQLGQSVTTISTCYDGAAWEDEPKEIVTDGPVLGWTGFVKVRRHDLAVLKPWLGSFIKQHDLRVIHAGWCPGIERETAFAEATGIDPERVSVQKAVTPDRYPCERSHERHGHRPGAAWDPRLLL